MGKSLAGAFRRRHAADLRELQRSPHVGRSIAFAGAHVALATAAAVVDGQLWARGHSSAAIGLYPLAVLFIGTRFRAMCNLMHESVHNTVAATPRQNRLFGQAMSLFDFTGYDAYAREHLTHHRHLGHPERDLDFAARRDLMTGTTKSFMRRHFLRALTLFHVPRYIDPVLWSKGDSLGMRLARFAHLAVLALLAHFVVGWAAVVLFYLVPYATAYQVIRYWSDAVDHAGILDSPDEIHRARNHIASFPLVNWLLFPDSDQYHLIHHLFPAIPANRLHLAHERLMRDPSYGEREHSFGALFRRAPERFALKHSEPPPGL